MRRLLRGVRELLGQVRRLLRLWRRPRELYSEAQRLVREPRWRARLAELEARLHPGPSGGASPGHSEHAAQLRDLGYTEDLGILDAVESAEIRGYMRAQPLRDPWRRDRAPFLLDEAPAGTHTAHADVAAVVRGPGVLALAAHPLVVDTVEEFFGCRATLDTVACWWSLPGGERPQEAQNWHRDSEHLRFAKLFCYLTDVEEADGPHGYVSGSAQEGRLCQDRRYTDEEVLAAFGAQRMIRRVGRAGHAFLENTFGVHRGHLPTARPRLLLQFTYSVVAGHFPPEAPFLTAAEADRLAGAGVDRYLLRKFLLG